MRVRPPPAMTVAPASPDIGLVEIRAIVLPRTSTCDGAESVAVLPSKMRTFSKIVAGGGAC